MTRAFQTPGGFRLQQVGYNDYAEALPLTQRCLFCPVSFTGPAAAAREWGRTHRELAHPGACDRGLKARRQAARVAA